MGRFFVKGRRAGGGKNYLCMHGKQARNRCKKEAINGRDDENSEGTVHAKIHQLSKKRKWRLTRKENKNGKLRSYFSSGASFEAGVWTSGKTLWRKNPRVQSL